MSESNRDDIDPTAPEQREIGREMVDENTGLGSVMAHFYRGEMSRVTTWRQRLDETTKWTVTVMAAILTWAFSNTDNPHYLLLIAIGAVATFLGIEARRYQHYDVYRTRVRILQENLFANALDPTHEVEDHDWRVALSEDFRTPTTKISFREALSNRLRRVYLALLCVLLVAWLFRITAFTPGEQTWLDAAGIAYIPGVVVVGALCVFYGLMIVITIWPRKQHARGELHEGNSDDWDDIR